MKPLDFDSLHKKCLEQIEVRKFHHTLIETIEPLLKKFEGKLVSKRIMNEVKKALPMYTYYWDAERSYSRSFRMWGNGLLYDERITIYLPVEMDLSIPYSHSRFIETNQCHFLDRERNELALKQLPFLKDAVTRFNEITTELKEIQSKFTEYPLAYIFEKGGE